jgi:hypothetical protein
VVAVAGGELACSCVSAAGGLSSTWDRLAKPGFFAGMSSPRFWRDTPPSRRFRGPDAPTEVLDEVDAWPNKLVVEAGGKLVGSLDEAGRAPNKPVGGAECAPNAILDEADDAPNKPAADGVDA